MPETSLVPGRTGAKLAEVRYRFKLSGAAEGTEHTAALARSLLRTELAATTADYRFAAAAAELAENPPRLAPEHRSPLRRRSPKAPWK